MTDQLLQALGALMILVPYALVLSRRASDSSLSYLLSNAAGGTLLAVLAAAGHNWGFVALEAAWAVVALRALFFGERSPRVTEPPPRPTAGQRVEALRARLVAHDAWVVVFGDDGPCGCSTCVDPEGAK